MNGIVTSNRYARVLDLPISFPQTELGAGKVMVVTRLALALHQRLELRSLTIHLVSILTPGVVPVYLNTAMGLCSVALCRGQAVCSPLAYARVTDQATTANPFAPCTIETPGTYTVLVSNNTSNADMAVAATGALKLYF